jgi:hypothetical protein
MPWKEWSVMDERLRFVGRLLDEAVWQPAFYNSRVPGSARIAQRCDF